MMDNLFKSFQLSTLCVAMLCANSAVFAVEELEQLDDFELASSTGEGIAMLPENAYMVFRGATETVETQANILADRTKDTGYINYIPVGPLTPQAAASGAGKADLYLYGLAISKADGNLNNRLGSDPEIRSWGTAGNPWLLKVSTKNQIPNFSQTNCTGATDASCQVTALTLEAPLHHNYALDYTDNSKDLTNNMPTTGENGADAYKLKLGLWADAFVLDPTKAANDATRFDLNGANRANRLRLQAVWDGLSINGSHINVFQTLGGANTSNAVGQIRDTSYNHTLGLSGLLRFNSGDTRNLKADGHETIVSTLGTPTIAYLHNGANEQYGNQGTGCNNGSAATVALGTGVGCMYRIRSVSRTDSLSVSKQWKTPDLSSAGVLRLSTRESGVVQGLLDSPAISSSAAPTFDASEGLHLYGVNINLVFGNFYQPVMFNKEANSNNFSLEVARIPNKPEIYQKIYQDYDKVYGTTYKGSTCSVYACGAPLVAGNTTYQGNSATHSSISIGSTEYNTDKGIMTAFSGDRAIGVSFGALDKTYDKTQSFSDTKSASGIQYQTRIIDNHYWINSISCEDGWFSSKECIANMGNLKEWAYLQENGSAVVKAGKTRPASTTDTSCRTSFWTTSCQSSKVTNDTQQYGTTANRSWGTNSEGYWSSAKNQNVESFIGGTTLKTGNISPSNLVTAPKMNLSPTNNFGSAVIDGLLIQHLKITTKGL